MSDHLKAGLRHGIPKLLRAILFAVVFVVLIEVGLFRSGIFLQITEPASYCGQVVSVLINARNFEKEAGETKHVLVLGDSRMGEGFSAKICDELGQGNPLWFNSSVPGSTPRVWSYLLEELLKQGNRFDVVILPLQNLSARTSERYMADRELDGQFMPPLLSVGKAYEFSRSFDKEQLRRKMLIRGFIRSYALKDDIAGFLSNPRKRFKGVARAREAYKSHYAYSGREEDITNKVWISNGEVEFSPEVSPDEKRKFELLPEALKEDVRLKEAAYQRRWIGKIEALCNEAGAKLVILLAPRGPLGEVYDSEVFVDAYSQLNLSPDTTVLPAETFSVLEKPSCFFDHLHMNSRGRKEFSTILYSCVARLLAGNMNTEINARRGEPLTESSPSANNAPAGQTKEKSGAGLLLSRAGEFRPRIKAVGVKTESKRHELGQPAWNGRGGR